MRASSWEVCVWSHCAAAVNDWTWTSPINFVLMWKRFRFSQERMRIYALNSTYV